MWWILKEPECRDTSNLDLPIVPSLTVPECSEKQDLNVWRTPPKKSEVCLGISAVRQQQNEDEPRFQIMFLI